MTPAIAPPPPASGQATGAAHRARRLFIDTGHEAVVYLHRDSELCRSEGFESETRIRVSNGTRSVLATLNVVTDGLLSPAEAGLSESAWSRLEANDGAILVPPHRQRYRARRNLVGGAPATMIQLPVSRESEQPNE